MDKKTKEELKEMRRAQDQERMKQEKKVSMVRSVSIWGGIAILLAVGGYAIFKTSGSQEQSPSSLLADATSPVPPITKDDNVLGPANAKVTIVEYGDFQCPACGAYYPLVKQLEQDEKGKIRIVYRYFPLTQVHPNAMIGAQAAYAASQQGKFWEMHDTLYSHQNDWADKTSDEAQAIFLTYAKSLHLDTDKFTEDMHSKAATDLINSEENKGVELGVNATPSFYVNSKFLTNPQGYPPFKAVIDQELKK